MVKLQFAMFLVENQIGVENSLLLMNTGMKHYKSINYRCILIDILIKKMEYYPLIASMISDGFPP
jgi:hypothetical protein